MTDCSKIFNIKKMIDANSIELSELNMLPSLPDHILGKIIKFVPIKDNCFLVNKTFENEAMFAMKNRCFLTLDEKTVRIVKNESKNKTLTHLASVSARIG